MRVFSVLLALLAAAPVAAQETTAASARVSGPVSADTGVSAARETADDDTVGVYDLRSVDRVPRPMSQAAFKRAMAQGYPPAQLYAGRMGRVQVRFIVEEDGRVSHASITHSTDPAFNQPTLDALPLLRFRPARVNGRPVRVWVQQPIEWAVQQPEHPMDRPPRP